MRLARAQDFRRRLHEKASSWPITIKRFSFSSIPSLGEGDIPLLSPLSVLSGPNGVGKTTLLRLLWSVLDPDAAKSKPIGFARLKSGTATVEVAGPSKSFELGLDFGSREASSNPSRDELELEVAYIDTSNEGPRIQNEFSNSDNPEDIINGAGPIELNSEQLTEINFLTMRNYRQVNLYEVELGDEVVPFFEVSFGPDRYDSRSMGSGEFSAFFLWWRLQRATPKSIVLIEEPECFLSPGSQSAFTDFLLKVLCSRKICAVVSSHSAEIINPLPSECIRFFRREQNGIALVTERPSPILLETIGIRQQRDILAFVEDEAAARFCRLLAERFAPFLSRRMIIVPKRGDGEIVNLLKQIDNTYDTLSILGIFDGDIVGKLPAPITAKASFLPGDQPVEKLFKILAEENQTELQRAIGSGDIREALFALQGRDHHDWFVEITKNFGLEPGQMFMILFRLWMASGDNEALARKAFEKIQQRIDPAFKSEEASSEETTSIPLELKNIEISSIAAAEPPPSGRD